MISEGQESMEKRIIDNTRASVRQNLLLAQDDIAEANVILGRASRALRIAGENKLAGAIEAARGSIETVKNMTADIYCEKVTT